jgi:hypothetical protein
VSRARTAEAPAEADASGVAAVNASGRTCVPTPRRSVESLRPNRAASGWWMIRTQQVLLRQRELPAGGEAESRTGCRAQQELLVVLGASCRARPWQQEQPPQHPDSSTTAAEVGLTLPPAQWQGNCGTPANSVRTAASHTCPAEISRRTVRIIATIIHYVTPVQPTRAQTAGKPVVSVRQGGPTPA